MRNLLFLNEMFFQLCVTFSFCSWLFLIRTAKVVFDLGVRTRPRAAGHTRTGTRARGGTFGWVLSRGIRASLVDFRPMMLICDIFTTLFGL